MSRAPKGEQLQFSAVDIVLVFYSVLFFLLRLFQQRYQA